MGLWLIASSMDRRRTAEYRKYARTYALGFAAGTYRSELATIAQCLFKGRGPGLVFIESLELQLRDVADGF